MGVGIPYAALAVLVGLAVGRAAAMRLTQQMGPRRMRLDEVLLVGAVSDVLGLLLSTSYLVICVVAKRPHCDAVLLSFILVAVLSLAPPYLIFAAFYVREATIRP